MKPDQAIEVARVINPVSPTDGRQKRKMSVSDGVIGSSYSRRLWQRRVRKHSRLDARRNCHPSRRRLGRQSEPALPANRLRRGSCGKASSLSAKRRELDPCGFMAERRVTLLRARRRYYACRCWRQQRRRAEHEVTRDHLRRIGPGSGRAGDGSTQGIRPAGHRGVEQAHARLSGPGVAVAPVG